MAVQGAPREVLLWAAVQAPGQLRRQEDLLGAPAAVTWAVFLGCGLPRWRPPRWRPPTPVRSLPRHCGCPCSSSVMNSPAHRGKGTAGAVWTTHAVSSSTTSRSSSCLTVRIRGLKLVPGRPLKGTTEVRLPPRPLSPGALDAPGEGLRAAQGESATLLFKDLFIYYLRAGSRGRGRGRGGPGLHPTTLGS